ncbi:hypothetical protein [Mesorhizobium caraganae]|uniref:hypothetical protein n=1 Tax=Mesorhizobium caraganae TaxID=483206 RepID=UPI00333C2E56
MSDNDFFSDLVELARRDELPAVVGRIEESLHLYISLQGSEDFLRNPLVVGPDRSGKMSVVYQMIKNFFEPERFGRAILINTDKIQSMDNFESVVDGFDATTMFILPHLCSLIDRTQGQLAYYLRSSAKRTHHSFLGTCNEGCHASLEKNHRTLIDQVFFRRIFLKEMDTESVVNLLFQQSVNNEHDVYVNADLIVEIGHLSSSIEIGIWNPEKAFKIVAGATQLCVLEGKTEMERSHVYQFASNISGISSEELQLRVVSARHGHPLWDR